MELISPYNKSILKSTRAVRNNIYFEKKRNPSDKTFEEMSKEVFDFNNCEVEICSICNSEMNFISFGRKFKCTELCEENKKQTSLDSSKKHLSSWHLRRRDEEYQLYVLKNIEFYKNNLNEVDIYEPFFNKKIGNITTKAFLSRNLSDTDYFGKVWGYDIKCKYCDQNFRWSLFKKERDYCQKKSCSGIERYVETKKSTIDRSIKAKLAKSNLIAKICDKFETSNPSEWINDFKNIKISRHDIKVLNHQFKNEYSLELLSIFVTDPKQNFLVLKEGILPERTPFTKVREYGFEYYSVDKVDDKNYLDFYKPCPVCKRLFYKSRGVYCSHDCRAFTLKFENVEHFYPNIFNTQESRNRKSEQMKEKIRKGEWTPAVTNSYAKSRIYVTIGDKIIPCRSSWEAVFQIANPTFKFEKTRIPYILENKTKNYIVDFTDEESKQLFEIKPDSEACGEKYFAKFNAATEWCRENGYTYNIIGNDWFYKFFREIGSDILNSQPEFKKIIRNMRMFIGDKK